MTTPNYDVIFGILHLSKMSIADFSCVQILPLRLFFFFRTLRHVTQTEYLIFLRFLQ